MGFDDTVTTELTTEECWELLRADEFGRLAFRMSDEVHLVSIGAPGRARPPPTLGRHAEVRRGRDRAHPDHRVGLPAEPSLAAPSRRRLTPGERPRRRVTRSSHRTGVIIHFEIRDSLVSTCP